MVCGSIPTEPKLTPESADLLPAVQVALSPLTLLAVAVGVVVVSAVVPPPQEGMLSILIAHRTSGSSSLKKTGSCRRPQVA